MNDTELKALLQSIIDADKTPIYSYTGSNLNARGIAPANGERWLTPREICEAQIKSEATHD